MSTTKMIYCVFAIIGICSVIEAKDKDLAQLHFQIDSSKEQEYISILVIELSVPLDQQAVICTINGERYGGKGREHSFKAISPQSNNASTYGEKK